MDGLVKGSVDIGLLRPIVARPGIVSPAPHEGPSGRGAARRERIAGRHAPPAGDPLPWANWTDLPLLMYSTKEARYFHDLVLRLFASAGAHANITQYASQVPALLAFVQAGLGVTLVPASAMASHRPGSTSTKSTGRHGMQELNRVDLELAWNEETANPAVRRLARADRSEGLVCPTLRGRVLLTPRGWLPPDRTAAGRAVSAGGWPRAPGPGGGQRFCACCGVSTSSRRSAAATCGPLASFRKYTRPAASVDAAARAKSPGTTLPVLLLDDAESERAPRSRPGCPAS